MKNEKNFRTKDQKNYKEVNLDGRGSDKNYRNPLTNVFQYEYVLYTTVSELFASVKCRAMCIDSMKLYFKELPHGKDRTGDEKEAEIEEGKKKMTQEGLIAELAVMVSRDVVGHISFPMMNICQAEVRVTVEENGTHTFIFSDGIYGFSVRLDMPEKKKKPEKIIVENIGSVHPVKISGKNTEPECITPDSICMVFGKETARA